MESKDRSAGKRDAREPRPPKNEDVGNGWYRRRWIITTKPTTPLQPIRMPRRYPEHQLENVVMNVPMALVITAIEPGRIVVETFIRNESSVISEFAYLSLVFQEIARQYTAIWIDGYQDHTILHISRLELRGAAANPAAVDAAGRHIV